MPRNAAGSPRIDRLSQCARPIAGLDHGHRLQSVVAADRRLTSVAQRVDPVLCQQEKAFQTDALHGSIDVIHRTLLIQRGPPITSSQLERAISVYIQLTGGANDARPKIGVL